LDDDEERLQTLVSSLTQKDLNKVISYRTMKFGEYKNPLWQSMQHMVNHSTYHRGQIATLLRQLDAKPISSDLMHFYRERSQALSA
jgi:uncharacterized damage-inducible protein DinB